MSTFSEADLKRMLDSYNKKNGEITNAVGYCRFSSEHQKELSIEAQQREISKYAKANGFEIVEWYIDRAYSGKTINRPEFQRLLKDVESKGRNFEAVIVHKIDRFSRNTVDSIQYREILAEYKVKLFSVTEKIEDNDLMYEIMAVINQNYLKNLAKEVMKGHKEKAYKMEFNGGTPPLGYDIVDSKYVINEQEAVIVSEIFNMAAKGYGYNTIINVLNEKGYRTKIGNTFGKNSLYDILKNERYKGVYIFNKRDKRSRDNTRNSRKFKDESEIIRIEGGCPAIVSAELWDRANTARRLSAKTTTSAKTPYLLTGLIYCGECGCKMHGNRRKGGENGYSTYKCNKKSNKLTCTCREIRTDVVEEFVISNLLHHLFRDGTVDIITQQVNELLNQFLSKNEVLDNARNALQGLKIVRSNLVDAISNMGYNETLNNKLESIEKQIQEKERIIEIYNVQKISATISKEEVQKHIDKLRDYFEKPDLIDHTKMLLRQYIDKIEVSNKTVKVTLKVAFTFYLDGKEESVVYRYIVSEFRNNVEKSFKAAPNLLPKTMDHRDFLLFWYNRAIQNSRNI